MKNIKSKLKYLLIINLIISMPTNAQERIKSPEELKLEEDAAKLKSQESIAQSQLAIATAKKANDALNAPPSAKEDAETQKAIAVANSGTFDALKSQLKGPDVTAPTGKITSEGTFIESQILSRRSLTSCFNELVSALKTNSDLFPKDSKFVFYNQSDFPAIELYSTIDLQLKALESAFKKENKEANDKLVANPQAEQLSSPLLMGYAVSGILHSAAEIVSLFKTTTDYKNFDITIDEMTLVSTLKKSIATSASDLNWKVYFPAVYPINTILLSAAPSAFITQMNKIDQLKLEADDLLKKLDEKVKAETTIAAGESDAIKKAKHIKYISDCNVIVTNLKSLINSYSQLGTFLLTADATTKLTAQSAIMRAEKLITFLRGTNVYVIKIAAVSKGSNKKRDNLWHNESIKHSAGTNLDCLIFGSDGEVVFSTTLSNYIPYKNSDEIVKQD